MRCKPTSFPPLRLSAVPVLMMVMVQLAAAIVTAAGNDVPRCIKSITPPHFAIPTTKLLLHVNVWEGLLLVIVAERYDECAFTDIPVGERLKNPPNKMGIGNSACLPRH